MARTLMTPQTGVDIVTTAETTQGPILVATDGTASSAATLRAAAKLAGRSSAAVTVLTVLEPLPLVAADYGLLLPPAETDDARRAALRHRVEDQIVEVIGAESGWILEVRDGDPAATIARAAREQHARLIVLGIGHHDLIDRMFGGETALHTLRIARCPVLAVAPSFTEAPTRIAIAVDFSEHSVRAARTALELLGDVTMVYLVHVAPRIELQPEAYAMWMTNYGEGVSPAFGRFRAAIPIPPGATVETVTLTGKPSRALAEFARSTQVDLVVTGSRGAGLIDRLLVGSTATGLIRGAHCSILAVPAVTDEARHAHVAAEGIARGEWASALDGFTRRNAGRRATLEVDDPEFGAQEQQHDYPFIGAVYDHHDERIELMLGEMEGTTHHLTRGIADVRRVDLLQDAQERDWILRIAHGSGQTILTLQR